MCNFCRLLLVVTVLASMPRAHAIEIFWNDEAGIHRVETMDPSEPRLLFETFDTRGLTIDAAGARLAWSDVLPLGAPIPGGVIRSGRVDGGVINDVVTRLTSPAGVALDSHGGRVYWTDLGDALEPSAVFSANQDGSDVRRLISGPALSEIAGIALDAPRDKLYFTYINPLIDSLFTGAIARADLDGSNVETIVGGLATPLGIAVDPVGNQIFWADAGLNREGGNDGTIMAADFSGGGQRTVLGGLSDPYGVALDLQEQNVYWTDRGTGKIQRTVMSGMLPFLQDVVTGLRAPTAITIVPEPPAMVLAIIGGVTAITRVLRRGTAGPEGPGARHRPACHWKIRN